MIGPFAKPTNLTSASIFIYTQLGDGLREIRRFDIMKSTSNRMKPDMAAFDIELDINETMHAQLNLSLQFTTNANDDVIFQMFIDSHSLDATMGVICGGVILILLNVLIISEVTDIDILNQ